MPRPNNGKSSGGVPEKQPRLKARRGRIGRPQPSDAQIPVHQKVPDPILPPPRKRNLPLQVPPLPLPDYEYYDNNPDEPDEGDIIVYGSDNDQSPGQEADTERKNRLRRIHTHALRYLAGERIYIHSARLRGPVINNPWKRKSPGAGDMIQRPGTTDDSVRPVKKRRIKEHDDREILSTPTQKQQLNATPILEAITVAKPPPKQRRATKKAKPKPVLESFENDTIVVSPMVPIKTTRGKNTTQKAPTTKSAAKRTINKKASARSRSEAEPTLPTGPLQDTEDKSKRGPSTTRKRVRKPTIEKELAREIGTGIEITRKTPNPPISEQPDVAPLKEGTHPHLDPRNNLDGHAKPTDAQTIHSEHSNPSDNSDQSDQSDQSDESDHKQHPQISPIASTSVIDVAQENFQTTPGGRNITPTGNAHSKTPPILSFSEATPPSIFYGSKNLQNAKVTASRLVGGIKRVESEPCKKVPLDANTAVTSSQRKRAISAPMPADGLLPVKATPITPRGTHTIMPVEGAQKTGKKRKASVSVESGAVQTPSGGHGNEWVPLSDGFKYKKAGKKSVTRTNTANDDNGKKSKSKDEKAKASEKGKVKGKGKDNDVGAAKPQAKKAKVIDFAALSPFGGGQVVSKDGRPYTEIDDGGVSAEEGMANGDGKQSEPSAAGKHPEESHEIPVDPALIGMSTAPANLPLGDVITISNLPNEFFKQSAPLTKDGERISDRSGDISGVNQTTVNPKTPARQVSKTLECNTPPEVSGDPTPLITQSQPLSNTNRHSSPARSLSQQLVVMKPRSSQTAQPDPLAHDSPFYNTQRQLSAAKKGFMSILDTPLTERSSMFDQTPIPRPIHKAPGSAETNIMPQPVRPNRLPHFLSPAPFNEASAADVSGFDFNAASFDESIQERSKGVNSPSFANTTIESRQMQPPETPPAKSRRLGANIPPLSSPQPQQSGASQASTQDSEGEVAEPTSEVGAPVFSPFKTFNTPTKSQFGNFMTGFSPLRYSPDQQSPSQRRNLFGTIGTRSEREEGFDFSASIEEQSDPVSEKGKSKDVEAASTGDPNPVAKPSTWLGVNRPFGISFFNSSPPKAPQPGSSPPQFLPPSPPAAAREHSPANPISMFDFDDAPLPKTPVQKHRSLGIQPGEQSPGTKLAGDMLEMMGGSVWDIDDELRKIDSSTAKPTPQHQANGGGRFAGRALFSSASKRFGGSTRK